VSASENLRHTSGTSVKPKPSNFGGSLKLLVSCCISSQKPAAVLLLATEHTQHCPDTRNRGGTECHQKLCIISRRKSQGIHCSTWKLAILHPTFPWVPPIPIWTSGNGGLGSTKRNSTDEKARRNQQRKQQKQPHNKDILTPKLPGLYRAPNVPLSLTHTLTFQNTSRQAHLNQCF
jgi:hypothetical protein